MLLLDNIVYKSIIYLDNHMNMMCMEKILLSHKFIKKLKTCEQSMYYDRFKWQNKQTNIKTETEKKNPNQINK